MPKFSKSSLEKLAGCDRRLQIVLNEAILYVDFTVVWGHRGEEEQNRAFDQGFSKVRFPGSPHNFLPSRAVDLAPYPKLFSEANAVASAAEFSVLCGLVMGIAHTLGIRLKWGGDWDSDGDTTDQTLKDWGHLELID